jgi:hypothetical protein
MRPIRKEGYGSTLASVQSVRPRMKLLQVSAKKAQGMDEFLQLLEGGLLAARGGAVAGTGS